MPATIAVYGKANVKQWDAAIRKAQEMRSKVGTSMGDLGKGMMAGGAAAIGAAGAIAGVGIAALKTAQDYAMSVVTMQRATGLSAEAASAAAVIFQRYGVEGRVAGMVLKTLSTQAIATANSAHPLKTAFGMMGIDVRNANGSFKDQITLLKEVADWYSKQKDKTLALGLASKVLGRGYAAFLPILAGGAKQITAITDNAAKSGLILHQQALNNAKVLAGAMLDLGEKWQGFVVQIGLLLVPIATKVIAFVSALASKLDALTPKQRGLIVTIAMWAAGILAVGGVFLTVTGGILSGLASIGGVLASVGSVIAGLSLPVLAVVAAVAAVAVAAYLIYKNWAPIKDFFLKLWAPVKPVFDQIVGIVKGALTGAIENLKAAWAKLAPALAPLLPLLKYVAIFLGGILLVSLGIAVVAILAVVVIAAKLVQALTWVINVAAGFVAGLISAFTRVQSGASGLWAVVKAVFDKGVTAVKGVFSGLTLFFGGAWKVISNIFFGAILLLVDLFTGRFGKLRSDAQAIWRNIITGIQQMWNGIKRIFTSMATPIIEAAKTTFRAFLTFIQTLPGKVIGFFANLPARMLSIGTAVVTGLWNGVQSAWSTLKSGIGGLFKGLVSWIRNLLGIHSPSTIFASIGEQLAHGLAQGMLSGIGAVTSAASRMASAATVTATSTFGAAWSGPYGTPAFAGAPAAAFGAPRSVVIEQGAVQVIFPHGTSASRSEVEQIVTRALTELADKVARR